jgi:hypothetical protein
VGPGAPRGGGGGRDELERSQEPRAPPARLARDAAAGARKWSGSSVSSSMKAVRRSWAMWAPEHHGVAGGVGMNSKGPKNPVHRLPDWRVTLPLALSGPMRSENPCRRHLPAAGHVERTMSDAWWSQHRPADGQGAGEDTGRTDDAWVAHGGDGTVAQADAGSPRGTASRDGAGEVGR